MFMGLDNVLSGCLRGNGENSWVVSGALRSAVCGIAEGRDRRRCPSPSVRIVNVIVVLSFSAEDYLTSLLKGREVYEVEEMRSRHSRISALSPGPCPAT
jgi:hypothetical protein